MINLFKQLVIKILDRKKSLSEPVNHLNTLQKCCIKFLVTVGLAGVFLTSVTIVQNYFFNSLSKYHVAIINNNSVIFSKIKNITSTTKEQNVNKVFGADADSPTVASPFINVKRYFGCQINGSCDVGTTSHKIGGFYQQDFPTCNDETQTVNYDIATGKFTCKNDNYGTGGALFSTIVDGSAVDGNGFVTIVHNLGLAHPIVELWNDNILINNNVYPADGTYAYIQIIDDNTLKVDYASISSVIGSNLGNLYITIGGSGPQGPTGPGVSTSTANYFTYYNGTNSVTGTSFAQLLERGIVVTTNTYFSYVSSTDLYVSSKASIGTTTNTYGLNVGGYAMADRFYTTNPNSYITADGTTGLTLAGGNVSVIGGYGYFVGAGVGLYVQNASVFRGAISNDAGATLTVNGGTGRITNFVSKVGVNSTTPNATLVVTGTSTLDVVNFTSSTDNSLFKILTNGFAGLNVNTPQAVFDVRDITPTTTGAIFKVSNSAGTVSYLFVSSTATTIRGASGKVNFELGVSTDNGSTIYIHGDNATLSSDSNKALVVNGRGNLYLQSGGANRMLINSSGLVGVNTTTQSSLFTIQGRVNEDPFAIASTTGENMFRIKKNGNVGFGTSTPVANLAVASGITTTITVGYPGVGKVCQWNGASWTITAYASNSITPVITTSTSCR
jgi:hypothetical protein